MHDALAELAAGALRPVVAEATAKLERAAALTAVLAGFGVLVVASLIGLVAAGAVALAPFFGAAGAMGLAAGALLAASLAGVVLTRRALRRRGAPARPAEAGAGEGRKPAATPEAGAGGAGKAAGPAWDPTLIAAACATAAIILGPTGMMRAVRGAVEAVRLGASLLAGAELIKSLDLLAGAFRREEPAKPGSGGPAPAAAPRI